MEQKHNGLKTFEGVYTPTLLTILGVIMYLRLGWTVGHMGLPLTWLIIILAHVITLLTALSMSSMLTNMKIGAGGAYSIVTRSLGLEMGGSIGIPLYFSQTISIAFYITGFTELWNTFYPMHNVRLVGLIVWAVLTAISVVSARFAFRLQYVVLFAVALSIVSFAIGPSTTYQPADILSSGMKGESFWVVFAIFFPAVTGVLTGATMSGELADPRKSIIRGTLTAVGTGFIVYMGFAALFALKASPERLVAEPLIILDLAWNRPAILMGLMGAVLSSALSTLVSAPRTLSALGENRVIPKALFFSAKNQKQQPIHAIVFSSLIALSVLLAGNLDSLAELLTMFFLTTYGMINLVVFVEKWTGITSFRPTFSVPMSIPLLGMLTCFSVMVILNPIFSVVTFVIVTAIYYMLKKRNLTSPWGDVRSSIFVAIVEWAAQKVMSSDYHPRIWKPAIMAALEEPKDLIKSVSLLQNLVYPAGRLYCLTFYKDPSNAYGLHRDMDDLLKPMQEEGVFTQKIFIQSDSFLSILMPAMQCIQSGFLPPNAFFLTISNDIKKRARLKVILETISQADTALMCYWPHPHRNDKNPDLIRIWLRENSPNNDLAVLSAFQLVKNSDAKLSLCRSIDPSQSIEEQTKVLQNFVEQARLPVRTSIVCKRTSFSDLFAEQTADLHIVGMPSRFDQMFEIIEIANGSILFVGSKGLEDMYS